jgi:hypothetical protein
MRSLVAAVLCFVATNAAAAPRPISGAERAAVEMAADYLNRGPAAIAERLDSASPLRKFADPELLEEIETRLGPPAGARWDLQTVVPALQNNTAVFGISYPSGVDETVTFTLVASGDTFKVSDVQILAFPSVRPVLFAAAASATTETKAPAPPNALPIAGGIVAALIAIFAAFGRRMSASMSRLSLVGALAIAIGFVLLPNETTVAKPAAVKPAGESSPPRLASLLPLRRAMTTGTADAATQSTAACHEATCTGVAALWRAQLTLQQVQAPDVERSLAQFPPPSNVPLAEIVRGRAQLLKANETDAALAYETAMNLGPGRDGLWYETAQALMSLGFNDRAERYLRRLERLGSREADVYYSLAIVSATKNKDDDARKYLTQAWTMRPLERADLVASPALWYELRKPEMTSLISLSAPQEATFSAPETSTKPIHLSPAAVARISGQFLHVQLGESELQVPGGAALAPIGTPVVDSAAWGRDEDERGLRDFQQLATVARTSAALAAPALRRRFLRAADALAKRNRWADLISLTDGLSPKSEHVPAELFFLRNQALHRSGRAYEGQRLITELAASRVLQRRRDADSLQRLAEMFASDDAFDLAIAMYDRAQAIHSSPFNDERVRQIQMNKRLATKYSTVQSEHFEVHYPEDVHVVTAKQIDDILEAELKRLQKYVAVPKFQRVVVNVVWWDDFRSTYTGSDFILGFYNGKITIPLAGAYRFVPPVVSLMTHELCHAMISQATNDQAPHWFQEGLAQRVEMRDFHANAFNMYDDNHLIAMSLLDPVLRTSSDPEVISEAYIESQTVIRYVEATYGEAGVKKLLESFRTGATTDDAVQQLTGKSLTEFDTNLRTWGRSGARVFENPEPVHYETSDEPDSMGWTKKQ